MVVIPIRAVKHLLLIGGWIGIWMCVSSIPGNNDFKGTDLVILFIIAVLFFIGGVIWVYRSSFNKNVVMFRYYSIGLGILGLLISLIAIINGGTLADSVASSVLALTYSALHVVFGFYWIHTDKKPYGISFKINNYLQKRD